MDMANAPVCVIEDNKPIRKLYCTLLAKAGYKTEEFPNGNLALEWLKGNKPLGIICDILLPDIDGAELLQLIRQLPDGESFPIVAVTGFAQVNDREKFIGLGFDSYISKPINTSTFISEFKDVLSLKNH